MHRKYASVCFCIAELLVQWTLLSLWTAYWAFLCILTPHISLLFISMGTGRYLRLSCLWADNRNHKVFMSCKPSSKEKERTRSLYALAFYIFSYCRGCGFRSVTTLKIWLESIILCHYGPSIHRSSYACYIFYSPLPHTPSLHQNCALWDRSWFPLHHVMARVKLFTQLELY